VLPYAPYHAGKSQEGGPFSALTPKRLAEIFSVYLPLATLVSDVVLNWSADLAFIHKCTVNHPVEETSLKTHL